MLVVWNHLDVYNSHNIHSLTSTTSGKNGSARENVASYLETRHSPAWVITYYAEFGRSRSNSNGVRMGPKIWEAWGHAPLRCGLVTCPLPYHVGEHADRCWSNGMIDACGECPENLEPLSSSAIPLVVQPFIRIDFSRHAFWFVCNSANSLPQTVDIIIIIIMSRHSRSLKVVKRDRIDQVPMTSY